MTEDRLPLNELLQKAGDGDFLRAVAESVLQLLMEADVEGLIGAGRHERAADRLNWRNGYRDRTKARGNPYGDHPCANPRRPRAPGLEPNPAGGGRGVNGNHDQGSRARPGQPASLDPRPHPESVR